MTKNVDGASGEILDAVTTELSRFSSEVVNEVHSLRDRLQEEQTRVRALEGRVDSLTSALTKFDKQAAVLVDRVNELCAEAELQSHRSAQDETPSDPSSGAEPIDPPEIVFQLKPLDLGPRPDDPPSEPDDGSLGDLVDRALVGLSTSTKVTLGTDRSS